MAVGAVLALVVVVDGAPGLGDDVGGMLALPIVFTLAMVAFAGRRLSWRSVALAVAVTVIVVGLATVVDLVRAPDAAATSDAWRRRRSTTARVAWSPPSPARRRPASASCGLRCGVAGSRHRRLRPVRRAGGRAADLLPPGSPRRIGLAAALAAGLLGFVVNDSGVIVTAVVLVFVGPFLALAALSARDAGGGRPVLWEPPRRGPARPRGPSRPPPPASARARRRRLIPMKAVLAGLVVGYLTARLAWIALASLFESPALARTNDRGRAFADRRGHHRGPVGAAGGGRAGAGGLVRRRATVPASPGRGLWCSWSPRRSGCSACSTTSPARMPTEGFRGHVTALLVRPADERRAQAGRRRGGVAHRGGAAGGQVVRATIADAVLVARAPTWPICLDAARAGPPRSARRRSSCW